MATNSWMPLPEGLLMSPATWWRCPGPRRRGRRLPPRRRGPGHRHHVAGDMSNPSGSGIQEFVAIDGVDVDAVAAAVQACPDVAGLDGGKFGEVASYLPGRK